MAAAASITTYIDREFLFRLQTLVIDGGTEVLRNIFDQRLQNQPLNVVLAREQPTVSRLQRQKILTRVQYDSLYPSSGQLPTSSDLDITLIVCLLQSLPSLRCNQNYNWNVPPQTGDTSVEADICRLRGFRNEIAHISSTTGFQQSSFEAKWREIETVLLRLDQNSPTPNFSQTIDSYKYSPLDPANEQRIRIMIAQWQERDRGLEADQQQMKEDFRDMKKDIKGIKKDVSYLRQVMPGPEESEKAAEKNYVEMKSTRQQETVAFTAFLDHDIGNLGPDHIIQFGAVELNEGNAYNNHTGVLTAPSSGLYLFSFSVEDYHGHRIWNKLVVDRQLKASVVEWPEPGRNAQGSNTAVLRLKSGQSVWVAVDSREGDDNLQGAPDLRTTMFTGVLLFPE